MRRQTGGLYAIALAVLVVGLVAFGVPANALLFGAFVLACPLMMMFMMGGMRGGESPEDERRARTPAHHDQNQDPIVRR
jgi:hypothetical protein